MRSKFQQVRETYESLCDLDDRGERPAFLAEAFRLCAADLEQLEGASLDHARSLLDRARDCRSRADRVERQGQES